MSLMQTSYPRFYQNMTSDELMRACDLWTEMFAEDDAGVVGLAVKQLLTTLEFPPTIADVKKEISKLASAVSNEPTGIDEWNAIRKAIKNSCYSAKEEFDRLPSVAQRFVGSPQQLRDWAVMCDFNADVVRGQFMKQYESLKEREEYKAILDRNPKFKRLLDTKIYGIEVQNEETKRIET